MNRSKRGIGYFITTGKIFKEKMNINRVYCDDCNEFIDDNREVFVIPFLRSAYCVECGKLRIEDCEAVDDMERTYGKFKEQEFEEIFK